jgi:hypothetical protein
MAIFTFAKAGWLVNLDKIDMLRDGKDGYDIFIADKHVGTSKTIEEITVSLIPAQGEWECLSPCLEDDGTRTAIVEPVLGFGLNVLGSVAPITPTELDGIHRGYYGLRKKGEQRIYSRGRGTFESEDIWLASYEGDRV